MVRDYYKWLIKSWMWFEAILLSKIFGSNRPGRRSVAYTQYDNISYWFANRSLLLWGKTL